MRIAHLTNVVHGGAIAIERIHLGLRRLGVDSRVFGACAVNEGVEFTRAIPSKRLDRITKLRNKWLPNQSSWAQRIQNAAKVNPAFEAFTPPVTLREHDLTGLLDGVDVLHLHWVGGFFDFREFFANVSIPVVWTMHDQNPYFGGFHYQGDVDAATDMLPLEYECRAIKREALAGLNLTMVGNSEWNCVAARSTGVLPEYATVERVYLPLPLDEYVPQDKDHCKTQLGIDPGRYVIGFACASMNNRRKGFIDLVRAIKKLPTAVQANTTIVSFGHQPSKSVREQVCVPWIHCGQPKGGVQQSPIYSAMDVFVIPSLEEAFGQTALEALACQTAVVGTSVGGIPEMIRDNQTGLLCPPRSPDRLSECLERFFEDKPLREKCGILGREHAIRNHAPDSISDAYLNLYRRASEKVPTQTRNAA